MKTLNHEGASASQRFPLHKDIQMERADALALPLRDREETDGESTVMEECNEIGKTSLPKTMVFLS